MIVTGDLIGVKDGTNTSFLLLEAIMGSVLILFNASALYQVASSPGPTQCVFFGFDVTLGLAPDANANLMYYGDDEVEMHHGDLTGTKNDSNQNFTLPESLVDQSVLIIFNTSILYPVASSPGPTQCIVSGSSVAVGFAPSASDNLWYYGEPA
jgi:hypothetical protein